MSLSSEAKRCQYGNQIENLANQVVNAITVIKMAKQNILNLRAEMEKDKDIFTEDDLRECDAAYSEIEKRASSV